MCELHALNALAKEISLAGLYGNNTILNANIDIDLYSSYQDIIKEMFDVPERTLQIRGRAEVLPPVGWDVVLVSGGLDSTIAYEIAKDSVKVSGRELGLVAVFCDWGQEYCIKERTALHTLGIPYIYRQFPSVSEALRIHGGWEHIIPGRNFLALTTAATLLMPSDMCIDKPRRIWFSPVFGEMPETGGDKSWKFIQQAEELISHHFGTDVEIYLSLSKGTKADWVRWWVDSGKPIDRLRKTVTCFSGGDKHCGQCQACLRRYVAFAYNDIDVAEDFEVHPLTGAPEAIEKYRRLMGTALATGDFSRYPRRRCEQTLSVIGAK